MNEPTFVSGLIIKTHTFDNGGEIIKLSFKIPEFAQFVKEHKNGDWLNIDIKTSKKGAKYAVLNTYKSSQKREEETAKPEYEEVPDILPIVHTPSIKAEDLPW